MPRNRRSSKPRSSPTPRSSPYYPSQHFTGQSALGSSHSRLGPRG